MDVHSKTAEAPLPPHPSPPFGPIVFIFMQFSQFSANFGQIIVWRPPGKSWVRRCIRPEVFPHFIRFLHIYKKIRFELFCEVFHVFLYLVLTLCGDHAEFNQTGPGQPFYLVHATRLKHLIKRRQKRDFFLMFGGHQSFLWGH